MPKRLAILRHAKSDWGVPGLSDFERPLNGRGRKAGETLRMAMTGRRLAFDVIISSPAARTRQTLDQLGLLFDARLDDSLYLASTDTLLRVIRVLPENAQTALLVGHNPGLQEIVLGLAKPDGNGFRERVLAKFPTAALALLDLEIEAWSDTAAGCGTIVELLLPRELA